MKAQALLVLLLATATVAGTAQARPYYGHRWAAGYHYYHYDPVRWRGGYWAQTWHGGRYGWWWWAGGAWVLYSAPIYPYPDADLAPLYVVEDQAPPPPMTEAAPANPPPQAQPQVRYYCPSPQGYYPQIPACPAGWQTLPVAPRDNH